MSQLEQTIVRICRALLREFDGDNSEYVQSTVTAVPDELTSEASQEVQKVAETIENALEAAKPEVTPPADVKDERLGAEVTNMDKGVKGIVVETKQRGWVVIEPTHAIVDGEWEKVSKPKPMSVRWKNCIAQAEVKVSEGVEGVPNGTIIEVVTKKEKGLNETHGGKLATPDAPALHEKLEVSLPKPESDNTDAGSYRMTTGIHAGKSIHEIYVDLVDGEVFLRYLAKKTSGLYGEEAKNAAKEYLLSQGLEI